MEKNIFRFVHDLTRDRKLSEKCCSIVLFGEIRNFKPGISDVDLLFVIKDKINKKTFEKSLFKSVLKLDRKYKLKIAEVCFGFHKNPLSKVLRRTTNYFYYRMPYYVFHESQFIPERLTIKDWKVKFLSIFGSFNNFWFGLKKNGKILKGKDIIKKIGMPKPSKLEKWKNLFFLFLLGILTLLTDRTQGKHILSKIYKFKREWI